MDLPNEFLNGFYGDSTHVYCKDYDKECQYVIASIIMYIKKRPKDRPALCFTKFGKLLPECRASDYYAGAVGLDIDFNAFGLELEDRYDFLEICVKNKANKSVLDDDPELIRVGNDFDEDYLIVNIKKNIFTALDEADDYCCGYYSPNCYFPSRRADEGLDYYYKIKLPHVLLKEWYRCFNGVAYNYSNCSMVHEHECKTVLEWITKHIKRMVTFESELIIDKIGVGDESFDETVNFMELIWALRDKYSFIDVQYKTKPCGKCLHFDFNGSEYNACECKKGDYLKVKLNSTALYEITTARQRA